MTITLFGAHEIVHLGESGRISGVIISQSVKTQLGTLGRKALTETRLPYYNSMIDRDNPAFRLGPRHRLYTTAEQHGPRTLTQRGHVTLYVILGDSPLENPLVQLLSTAVLI